MPQHIPEQLEPLITQATDAALLWARLDAGFGLLGGLIALALAVFIYWYFVAQVRVYREQYQKNGMNKEHETWLIFVFGAGLVPVMVAVYYLFNPWRWVGVFEPSVWIVHRAASVL